MKRLFYIAAALAAFAAASCEPKVPEPDITPAPDFIAVIDNGATKTSFSIMDGAYNIAWEAGDEVLVKGSSSGIYKVKTGGSQRSDLEAVSGNAGNGPFTAVYPANLADNQELPSVIDYCDGVEVRSPMTATSSNNILPFKSACGMLMMSVTSEAPINVSKIVMTADKPLSGKYELIDGAAVIRSGEGVTIECGEGIMLGKDGINVAFEVPEGRYSEISFHAIDADGREYIGSFGDRPLIVERSKVCAFDLRFGSLKHLTTTLVDGPVFNQRLKSLSNGKTVDSTMFQDKRIKKLVFETGSAVNSGTELQMPGSDYKIFANFDAAEGVMTVSTQASEMFTSRDASCMFQNFQQVAEIVNLPALNTSKAKTMKKMFSQDTTSAAKLVTLDLSGFDTSSVTDMDSMFFSARYLTELDLTSFDTSNVKDFTSFLNRCQRLTGINLSSFDIKAAETMEYMFANCPKLVSLDLTSFVAESALSTAYMFTNDSFLESIAFGSFGGGNIENMDNMFSHCVRLTALDVSSFDTGNVSEMRSMFNDCERLTSLDLRNFDVTSVTRMSYMFYHCYAMETLDLSSFNLTVLSPNCDYFFCRMYNLKELYLGDTFILNTTPNYYVLSSSDGFSTRTGNKPGAVTIYCNDATAEFIAITNWRWINSGYNGQKAIPVTFRDYETHEIFTVTWAAN
jgi:surface protein